MLEREFIIDAYNEEFEFFHSLDDDSAQSICENDLEIPADFIKNIECYEDVFKVQLTKSRAYYRDDWYVNLQRLEYVS